MSYRKKNGTELKTELLCSAIKAKAERGIKERKGKHNQEEWVPFMDVLALLIFGVVLYPNVDGLVDLASIDAFHAYHHSKESPVVVVLANLFDTFDRR